MITVINIKVFLGFKILILDFKINFTKLSHKNNQN